MYYMEFCSAGDVTAVGWSLINYSWTTCRRFRFCVRSHRLQKTRGVIFFLIVCRSWWRERQKNKVIANTRAEKGSPFLRRAAFPFKLNFHSPACYLVCANKILIKALVRRVYQPVAAGQVRWFLLNAEKCLVVNCCGLLRCKHLPMWFQNVAGCELAFIRAPCYLHLWPSLSVKVPSFQKNQQVEGATTHQFGREQSAFVEEAVNRGLNVLPSLKIFSNGDWLIKPCQASSTKTKKKDVGKTKLKGSVSARAANRRVNTLEIMSEIMKGWGLLRFWMQGRSLKVFQTLQGRIKEKKLIYPSALKHIWKWPCPFQTHWSHICFHRFKNQLNWKGFLQERWNVNYNSELKAPRWPKSPKKLHPQLIPMLLHVFFFTQLSILKKIRPLGRVGDDTTQIFLLQGELLIFSCKEQRLERTWSYLKSNGHAHRGNVGFWSCRLFFFFFSGRNNWKVFKKKSDSACLLKILSLSLFLSQ